MAANDEMLIETGMMAPHVSEFRRFIRVLFNRPPVIFGIVVILLVIFTAIVAPLLAPYDPYDPDLSQTLQNPSPKHLLGTDSLGRDVLSRLIYGSRNSLMIGLVALAIASIFGMSLGLLAGYFGGWLNAIIMRVIDSLMSFPTILLALVIAALLGGGMRNVMIAIGISMLPGYARLMCGQVLSIKESDYVTAANISGATDMRVMFRHLLPNAFPPLLVLITLNIGTAIMMEAMLSFLGMGILPPEAAWGSMVNDGYRYLITNPILSIAPGVAIMVVILGFNLVGDGLRDALDPRLRGTI